MDWVIEYLDDLAAFIKKNTQISNTGIFSVGSDGLSCIIIPDSIAMVGPTKTGRELRLTIQLSGPLGETDQGWKAVFQALAKLDRLFTSFESVNNDLKMRFTAVLNGWSRISDESNLIFALSLTLRGIRQGA
jgi:hypothetical protein